MNENTTYELAVYCGNCDFRGKVKIPKGIRVNGHPCPNCDIQELEQDHNSHLSGSASFID